MTDVMMALGDYRFSVPTALFGELKRSYSWKWAAQERVGRPDAVQFLGPKQETVELNGTIYPRYAGGLAQIDDMVAEGNKGEPLVLVDGFGDVWGKYCMQEVTETRKHYDVTFVPNQIDFFLRLISYGEDR